MSTIKKARPREHRERYDYDRSPLAQNPTQRKIGTLTGFTKTQLEAIVRDKDRYTIRRTMMIGSKLRELVYPKGKLRSFHERLKFQCEKISQPKYLFSPRRGRSTRDNAVQHIGKTQFLLIDIKQFYPSTTSEHVYRLMRFKFGMRCDVAGLITRLATTDNKVFFGSPLTPVLSALIFREMFDEINEHCRRRGLRCSLWVDDLTISGLYIPGTLITDIRKTISSYGLRSHKIEIQTSKRPTTVTGIKVHRQFLDGPRNLHRKILSGYAAIYEAGIPHQDFETKSVALLSSLGTYRHIVGHRTSRGQTASNRMNDLRQLRLQRDAISRRQRDQFEKSRPPDEPALSAPWGKANAAPQ